MLIQDLNHVEMISEETHLEGGLAASSASYSGLAVGLGAATAGNASTTASKSGYFFFYPYESTSGNASSAASAFVGIAAVSGRSSSIVI